jgi:hypothetical protein
MKEKFDLLPLSSTKECCCVDAVEITAFVKKTIAS